MEYGPVEQLTRRITFGRNATRTACLGAPPYFCQTLEEARDRFPARAEATATAQRLQEDTAEAFLHVSIDRGHVRMVVASIGRVEAGGLGCRDERFVDRVDWHLVCSDG